MNVIWIQIKGYLISLCYLEDNSKSDEEYGLEVKVKCQE